MKFEVEDHVNFPHADVFETFLNNMEEVSDFIPDVKEIKLLDSSDKGTKHKRILHWVAKKDLPGFMKKFLDIDTVGWVDTAEWDSKKNCVDYSLEVSGLEKYVRVVGHNIVEPDGKGTRIFISGELSIEIEKHPAVPRLVGKGMRPKVEKFFIELIKPNLVNTNRALEKYLASKKG